MTSLLVAIALLVTSLTLYSLAHYACAAVFLLRRLPQRSFTDYPDDAVSVLVPARNEGESVLRVLDSLAGQDHRGPLTAFLLVKDGDDSAIPFLARRYPDVRFDVPAPATIELPSPEAGSCAMAVVYTGLDPKSEKLNWMASRLSTPYLAILDADHQARPDWIRTSMCLLHERQARMVQARRGPLVSRGFFPLWDSLHQHIGCELFNVSFSALRLPVFFTGTTAVLETELLLSHPLSECITEDVYLSYTLLEHGVRIIHNPYSGSYEETSPDLYSFLARRRRWSNGHTEAFFKHLSLLWSGPLALKERLQFLVHGTHYLMSVGVFALHLLIGLMFARELSPVSAGAAAVTGLMMAWVVSSTQAQPRGEGGLLRRVAGFVRRATELAVLFVWLAPALLIAMNLAQAILTHDPARTLLPGPRLFHVIGLVGLCAPLVVLLVGLLGFRKLGPISFVAVVSSYVVAFYLDLSGVLLGLLDHLTGGARWQVVHRAPAPLVVEAKPTDALAAPFEIEKGWEVKRAVASSRTARKGGSRG